MITSVSSKNSHKAPLKPLGHLRLRELRRQPLQNIPQKAPQPTALNPPSTARTAGRSDWAERRFQRQPFILLSFSSSKKARKAQETQSYQRFQCIGHTDFKGLSNAVTNTHPLLPSMGTTRQKSSCRNRLQNGPRLLSRVKAGTHSPSPTGSHTAAYTPKQGPSFPRPQRGFALSVKSILFRHAFIYIHFPVLCDHPLSATALSQTIFHRVFQLSSQTAYVCFHT